MSGRIGKLRKDIDAIDLKIVRLMARRAGLAEKIGRIKAEMGEPVHHPAREAEIMDRLMKMDHSPLPDASLEAIVRELIGASLAIESPFTCAYLGPEATYTHQAAITHFGSSVEYVPSKSIREVFSIVESGKADAGVVPIENSVEGAVMHTLDRLIESDLVIVSEIIFRIRHALMAGKKTGRIRRILSHPQGLAQCSGYIEANYPGVEMRETSSTAEAAKGAAARAGTAAIASELAAETYGLEILDRNIEDFSGNETRFLVIAPEGGAVTKRTGRDKTSIAFSVRDKPGALYEMLSPFRKNDVNLTKIESRPSRTKAWRYVFFIDMEGYKTEKNVRAALDELRENTLFFRILGSYPRARVKNERNDG